MRKTTEQYKQEVREALGDEYIVVGEYTRAIDKIEIKHAVCGRLFYPRAKELLSGKWLCPYCASNAKKDTEKFKKEVFKLVGNEYSVLGEYVNANTHITMKHNKCGHTWNVIPYNFIGKSQNRCPRCYGNNKKSTKWYKRAIHKLWKGEYTLLGQYTGIDNPTAIRHNKCGNTFYPTPYNFINNMTQCPYCCSKTRKTHEMFVDEIKKITGNKYKVLSRYENAQTEVKMKHITCGHVFWQKPSYFIHNGSTCPKCRAFKSKGEEEIERILVRRKISYLREYKIEECKYISPLPFDFKIEYGKQTYLIEYQGVQHYKPVEAFGGNEQFKSQIRNDNIKRKYCKDNNITLIEIPYWIDDIEEYLLGKLNRRN